ncbi:MAG: PQQ-like beta-propeller repeat protein [bacterium]|nr:PQQ-like beta-propeller repeat protein [bacterium]
MIDRTHSTLSQAMCRALIVIAFASPLPAEDWPQWRGVHRDGIWRAEGIRESLPQGQLTIDWSVEVGPGYNGPTVANGRVYVMDRQTDGKQTERILCFDSASGKSLWMHEYEARYAKVGYTAGPRASVTIDDGRAYAVGSMGHFHCLDAASGEVIWQRDLNAEYEIDMPQWGIAASPLVYQALVIQQVAGSQGATMVAFDKLSGKEVWRALNEKAGYSSPIVIQQAGQNVLVCWTGESLSGLNPLNGSVHWSHEMKPTRMPIGIGTPSVDGDLIFVSSFYDGSLMIRAPKDSLSSSLVWRARGKDEINTGAKSVQLADGELNSQEPEYGVHAMIGTPIVQDGYVYAVDSYGQFRCLEALTGKRVWEDLSAVTGLRWATIHMIRQADRVWLFNDAGELMIAQPDPDGLNIQSRAQLIEPTKVQLDRRNGVCWSHPAFAEQSVFARNDNQLVRASLAE